MSDETEKEEKLLPKFVDGGNVIVMVKTETEVVPMPLPVIFEEMFKILGDLDRRLTALQGNKEDSRIILPN